MRVFTIVHHPVLRFSMERGTERVCVNCGIEIPHWVHRWKEPVLPRIDVRAPMPERFETLELDCEDALPGGADPIWQPRQIEIVCAVCGGEWAANHQCPGPPEGHTSWWLETLRPDEIEVFPDE